MAINASLIATRRDAIATSMFVRPQESGLQRRYWLDFLLATKLSSAAKTF